MFSSSAFAFGQVGHETVCQIAYNELNATAKAEVDRLIGLEPDAANQLFRVGCTWPDKYSQYPSDLNPRGSDHYINLPRGTAAVDGRCFNKHGNEVSHCLLNAVRRRMIWA
tara:strand:- start:17 stop:349 length:333 start_codon:yes stop_codon:yes gene_type:complete